MLTFDSIPQARVVREAGQLMTPPPPPRPAGAGSIARGLHIALYYAIGLWPLTCVVLLLCGLVIVSANIGTP